MKKYKYRGYGWIAFSVAVLALIAGVVLYIKGLEYPLFSLCTGVFSGSIVLSALWLRAGKNEQTSKQYEIDKKDERTAIITGKSALVSYLSVLIMFLGLTVWLFISGNNAVALIIYGIMLIGIGIFGLAKQYYEKRM